MLRQTLDKLYLGCGYLAAVFLVLIAVAIIVQVFGRLFLMAFDFTRLSGFFLAAATFLALPHTFKHGGHVRVELLTGRLRGRARGLAEGAACLVSALVIGYAAWHVAQMAWMSWEMNDVTTGVIALPFWMPQAAMATGLSLLVVALIDEWLRLLAGETPSYSVNRDAVL